MQQTLALASEADHPVLFLTVHHANHDAIGFYEAQGFDAVGDWMFRFEGIAVPNLVMKISLQRAESA